MAVGEVSILWCCLWACFLTDTTLAAGSCEHASYVYNAGADVCYDHDTSTKEYVETVALCAADSATLPIIHDQATQTAIRGIIDGDTWLGLRYRPAQRSFRWQDGSAIDYSNWKNNNDNPSCTSMKRGDGKWKTDSNCDNNKKVFCLKKDSTTATCDLASFDSGSNMCYQYTGANSGWDGAYTLCGGYLAVITTEAENLLIKGFIDADIWIGIKVEVTSTPFTWVDGADVTWTNWDSDEPIDKQCVQMKTNGEWEWKSCTDDKDTLCVMAAAGLSKLRSSKSSHEDVRMPTYFTPGAAGHL